MAEEKGEKGRGVLAMAGAVLQALVVATLLWVGNKTASSAEQLAALAAQVQGLEKQVARIQNSEDARQAEQARRDYRGIAEERPGRR